MSGEKSDSQKIIHLERMNKLLHVANEITAEVMSEINAAKKGADFVANSMGRLAVQKEKEMIHADRMSILGILSAGIAHEINNPTTFISGNLQIMERIWKDVDQLFDKVEMNDRLFKVRRDVPKMITDMKQGVKRIVHIVDGLKFFARKDNPDVVDCDIKSSLQQAQTICHPYMKGKIDLIDKVADGLPPVKANIQQLEQVFINLMTNATDALSNSSEKTLTISSELNENTRTLSIHFKDSGPGVPKAIISEIFKPFFTTKESGKGTGLGLSISSDIIKKINGQLTVKNCESGIGAIFTIALPY